MRSNPPSLLLDGKTEADRKTAIHAVANSSPERDRTKAENKPCRTREKAVTIYDGDGESRPGETSLLTARAKHYHLARYHQEQGREASDQERGSGNTLGGRKSRPFSVEGGCGRGGRRATGEQSRVSDKYSTRERRRGSHAGSGAGQCRGEINNPNMRLALRGTRCGRCCEEVVRGSHRAATTTDSGHIYRTHKVRAICIHLAAAYC